MIQNYFKQLLAMDDKKKMRNPYNNLIICIRKKNVDCSK